jgi:hypothetical protein
MSDEGKVLIGTDGNPLVGHDGKVVLADRLYPYRVSLADVTPYNRGLFAVGSTSATTSPVLEEEWDEPGTTTDLLRCRYWKRWSGSGAENTYAYLTSQRVAKYDNHRYSNYPDLEIPWGRVATWKFGWEIEARRSWSSQPAVTFRFLLGSKTATAPDGSNEPWDGTGWTQIASVAETSATNTDILASGTVSLPVETEPRFYLAIYADDITDEGSGVDPYDIANQEVQIFFTTFRTVTYNLALPA